MAFSSIDFIERLVRRLIAEFEDAGHAITPGLIGAARETPARASFQKLLPPLAAIGSGIVIDTYGDESRQQDIVIYERNLCPVFSINETPEATFFPCEGVVAVGEVKSCLDSRQISDCFQKLESVKKLKRLARPESDAFGGSPTVSFRQYGQTMGMIGTVDEQFDQSKNDLDQIFAFVLCGEFGASPATTLRNCVEQWRSMGRANAPNLILSLKEGVILPFSRSKNIALRSAMDADEFIYSAGGAKRFSLLLSRLSNWVQNGRTVNASVFRQYLQKAGEQFSIDARESI